MSAEPDYPYTCPDCGNHNLLVTCEVVCRMSQEGDGEFETEPDKNAEWYFDDHATMICRDCRCFGTAKEFTTREA
jgi:hypothetical protein